LFLLLLVINSWADGWLNYQNNYTEGTEFYVTFMNASTQAGVQNLDIALFMAARQSTAVTISDSISGLLIDSFTIAATNVNNSYHMWCASRNAPPGFLVHHYYCSMTDSVYNHSLKVTSSAPIALYMATSASASGDASLVMPTNRLGKEYVLQSPTTNLQAAEFAIVAVHDQTTVTITPKQPLATKNSPRPANQPFNVVLQRGQVYFAAAANVTYDLSGTTICADHDVMVFNGSQGMTTSLGVEGHVNHETTPIFMWGKTFALVKTLPQKKNQVKITALDDTTTITIHLKNSTTTKVIAPYSSYTHASWKNSEGDVMYIEADHPVVCFQYMLPKVEQPRDDDDNYEAGGRFSSTIITPIEQGVNSAMLGTFAHNVRQLTFYINIVCPTNSINTMKLDGVNIQASKFKSVPGLSTHSYVSLQISDSAHDISNSNGKFTAIAYAMTSPEDSLDWSYAHNVAMNCQHQDEYLLIDGIRTNKATKCKNNNNQWVYDFTAVINTDYDSVAWYYDRGRMSGDSTFTYTFAEKDSLEHPIYMYIYRTSVICKEQIVDTVKAAVNNAMTYNKQRPVDYFCLGDTIHAYAGTEFEKVIWADTLIPYKTYTLQQRFESHSGCDSIVHFKYQVLNPQDSVVTVPICNGSSFTYQDTTITTAGRYTFHEYEKGKCHYLKTINVVVNPVYDIPVYQTICDVELPYLWRHSKNDVDTLRSACADYVRTFKTKRGCDSVVHLHLTVGSSYDYPDSIVVCDKDLPYSWHGQSLTKSGEYHDNNKTALGCDSNYTLIFKVNPTYFSGDTVTICGNSSYTWRGKVLTRSGQYYDSLRTKDLCDSIYYLLLNVDSMYYFPTTDRVCQNKQYSWRGHTFTIAKTGTYNYYDSLEALNGCDSIYHLKLTVDSVYKQVIEREICQGATYEFAGDQNMTWMNDVEGHHRDTVYKQSMFQCDSVLILDLTVYPVYIFEKVASTCSNKSYHWMQDALDTTITQTVPGTQDYYVRRNTKQGCDSVYHLSLTVNDTIVVPRIDSISDQDSVVWENQVYAGTKYNKSIPDSVLEASANAYVIDKKYNSSAGCDSIMRLIITVFPTYELNDYATTCQYATYSIEGHESWSWKKDIVGLHDTSYTYETSAGYDSIRNLHLIVYPVYYFKDTAKTCCNTEYEWEGHKTIERHDVGKYPIFDSLKTVNGCDSIYERLLIVQDTIVDSLTHEICDIDTFRWDKTLFAGEKYSGKVTADSILKQDVHRFRRVYVSSTGCDSIITLKLTINPTYIFYDTIATCQNSPYHPNEEDPDWWTTHNDSAGVYDDIYTYETVNGHCDSIRHLHLTVYPEYTYEKTDFTCCNRDYVWEGHENIEIGVRAAKNYVFYDSLKTINGCDSVHILYLTVMDTIIVRDTNIMCDNELYVWDTLTIAGKNSVGAATADTVLDPGYHSFRHSYTSLRTECDSFMTLSITINPTYELYDTVFTCQNSPYHPNEEDPDWWTTHNDSAGVYDDIYTYETANGHCDSIRHLHLTVYPEYTYEDSAFTCSNTDYVWEDHERIQIGMKAADNYVIYDSLKTIDGCDSVHILYLTVVDTIVKSTIHSMCDVESFLWDGKVYAGNKHKGEADVIIAASAESYEYENVYTSVRTQCDSFERLTLTVHPTYLTVLNDTSICQNDTFYFCTKSIPCTDAGSFIYYDTLQSIHQCDSIIKVTLNVCQEYKFETRETICDNIDFTWREHTFSNVPKGDSIIIDHYLTIDGCDSSYVLYLKSISSYLFEDNYEMCDVDTTIWRSHSYYGLPAQKYVYYDSLKTLNGCDSVYKLTLTVHPHYYIHDTLTMCDNETIQLRHHTLHYPITGHYIIIDSLNSVYNCDSVIETSIFVYPTYLFTDNETICSNDSLLWRGKYYSSVSGIFYDSLKSKYGCDSVYKLIFNVIPAYKFETTATICSNESYYFQGQNLRDDGDHHFMYYSKNGCDSEYVLHLHVLPSYFMNSYETICSNETYNFRGRVLNQAGIYYDSIKTQAGCDSVFVLHLTVNAAHHSISIDNSHCMGDTVMFRGKLITNSGVYYDSLKTLLGCDSVFELQLNMKPAYLFETDTAICNYKSMKWRGNYYSNPGTYYDSLKTKVGCDSVYVLYLQVSPTDYDTIDASICLGDVYTLGSQACSISGTYYDTVRNARDFDCGITVLRLSTVEPSVFQSIHNPDICADDSFFTIDHRLLGEIPKTYSVLFDDAAKSQGFKDIVDEPYDGFIEVPVPECVREEWYVRPDNYEITVMVDNGICDPESNAYHGTMLVKYPSWVIEQRWNDVVAALNEYFNGNYKITNYEWIVNGSVVQTGNLSYIYMPGRLSFGDIVYARLTREGETYNIETCPIVIYDRTDKQTTDFHIIITGTPDPHGALQRMRLHADVDGKFFISDVTGKTLMHGSATADVPLDLELPYPAGVYFLYFYIESGEYKVLKFIVK